jgi:hypothetical protein
MATSQRENLHAMQRADEAAALRGMVGGLVNDLVLGTLNVLVAHYRGATLHHDVMVGKIGEISALLGLLDTLDGSMRAGEAAREKEFGNGQAQTDTPTPGGRPRSN